MSTEKIKKIIGDEKRYEEDYFFFLVFETLLELSL
jgi:hypothetical protein